MADQTNYNNWLVLNQMISGTFIQDPNSLLDQKIYALTKNIKKIIIGSEEDDQISFWGGFQGFTGRKLEFETKMSQEEYERFLRYLIQDHEGLESMLFRGSDLRTKTENFISQNFPGREISVKFLKFFPDLLGKIHFDDPKDESEWAVKILQEDPSYFDISTDYRLFPIGIRILPLLLKVIDRDRCDSVRYVIEILWTNFKKKKDYCEHQLYQHYLDLLPDWLINEHDVNHQKAKHFGYCIHKKHIKDLRNEGEWSSDDEE